MGSDGSVRRYRAVMPREAWRNGREPRERRFRRGALEDLVAGLDRYLAAHAEDVDLHAGRGQPVRRWAIWAAQLPLARQWPGPAPDGSEWRIASRREPV